MIRLARTLQREAGDSAVLDDATRDAAVAYLKAATVILATTAKAPDLCVPERGDVVPMSVHSDGEWIWSAAHAYYLEQHALVIDAALLAHIREQGFVCRAVDGAESASIVEAFYAAQG